jgi:biopolymer transport protein ExbD
MAIYTPGKRDRHNKISGGKRSVVAVLSLTAMVDLFTVLVVFLLQNYNQTGEVIEIPEGVELPMASAVKELKPANVVIISDVDVKINNDFVMNLKDVKSQEDWNLEPLRKRVEEIVRLGEEEKRTIGNKIKTAVTNIKEDDKTEEDNMDQFRKITVQADKQLDFLTLKKVMFSVTEGGAYEINFAVMKSPDSKKQ